MSWLTFLLVYALVWWTLFLMALPIGAEREEAPMPGHSTGAPRKTYLLRKILGTTVAAAPLTWLAVEYVYPMIAMP